MDVDKNIQEKVVTYLRRLNLDGDQALAYIFLLQNGPQTVLAISRGLKTGRTKLYPMLEALAAKQLISVHTRHYGTSYEAQPPEVLDFLVSEHEREADDLRGSLSAIMHALHQVQLQSPATSKIIEYRGIDGLKQMSWNLTKAEKEYRVFEIASQSRHLSKHFAEKVRAEQAEKGIISYNLTNNPERRPQTSVVSYEKYSEARFIPPSTFSIESETYIYGNVVALLSYENDSIFGVEIYNQKLAHQQRQFFDFVWSQAREIQ